MADLNNEKNQELKISGNVIYLPYAETKKVEYNCSKMESKGFSGNHKLEDGVETEQEHTT